VRPPQRSEGAFVRGGRCYYPAITLEPTGVVEIARGARLVLGDVFAVWGRRLGRRRLAEFRGAPVAAYLDGRRWRGDARAMPLAAHAEIVLELGGFVPPHRSFVFAPGR
jgi:hypothetical protein